MGIVTSEDDSYVEVEVDLKAKLSSVLEELEDPASRGKEDWRGPRFAAQKENTRIWKAWRIDYAP